MCGFRETLHESENAKVCISECRSCFRFRYNNIVLILNQTNFVAFCNNVEDCFVNVKNDRDQDVKDICFSTVVDSMFLAFSAKEIKEIYQILKTALIKYEICV